ncbi:hypothetical protein [Streptomyces phaeochromogenes]
MRDASASEGGEADGGSDAMAGDPAQRVTRAPGGGDCCTRMLYPHHVDEVNARGEAAWDELDEFEGFNHRELFGYRTTVQTIMTRLKLMGFDPDRYSQEMIDD